MLAKFYELNLETICGMPNETGQYAQRQVIIEGGRIYL